MMCICLMAITVICLLPDVYINPTNTAEINEPNKYMICNIESQPFAESDQLFSYTHFQLAQGTRISSTKVPYAYYCQ